MYLASFQASVTVQMMSYLFLDVTHRMYQHNAV